MPFEIVKAGGRNPAGKTDANWTAFKTAVTNAIAAEPGPVVSSAAIITRLRAALPAGWLSADVSEGAVRQACQELSLEIR